MKKLPSAPDANQPAQAAPVSGVPLAVAIPKGGLDTGLSAGLGSGIEAGELPTGPMPAQAPADGALKLPVGGRVIMRKSGGLRFTSRELVVYRNRRVGRGMSGEPAVGEMRLTMRQMASLEETLRQIVLADLAGNTTRQNPDAYAYEFAFRLSRRLHAFEVADGSIPPSAAALIRQLQSFTAPVG